MNTKQIIIASIAAASIATSAFAKGEHGRGPFHVANPESIVATMLEQHDLNQDGVLNSTELAQSIESLHDMRQNAIRNHRDRLIEAGALSESVSDNGIVTFSLLPEDGAAILIKKADADNDNALGAEELVASTRIWRSLNLGVRPYFGSQSS